MTYAEKAKEIIKIANQRPHDKALQSWKAMELQKLQDMQEQKRSKMGYETLGDNEKTMFAKGGSMRKVKQKEAKDILGIMKDIQDITKGMRGPNIRSRVMPRFMYEDGGPLEQLYNQYSQSKKSIKLQKTDPLYADLIKFQTETGVKGGPDGIFGKNTADAFLAWKAKQAPVAAVASDNSNLPYGAASTIGLITPQTTINRVGQNSPLLPNDLGLEPLPSFNTGYFSGAADPRYGVNKNVIGDQVMYNNKPVDIWEQYIKNDVQNSNMNDQYTTNGFINKNFQNLSDQDKSQYFIYKSLENTDMSVFSSKIQADPNMPGALKDAIAKGLITSPAQGYAFMESIGQKDKMDNHLKKEYASEISKTRAASYKPYETSINPASYIPQFGAAAYNLYQGLRGPDEVVMRTYNPEYLNTRPAEVLAQQNIDNQLASANYNARQQAQNSNQYLANNNLLASQAMDISGKTLGEIKFKGDSQNNQTLNQANQFNLQNQSRVDELRQQELDASRSTISYGLADIGTKLGQVNEDYRKNDAQNIALRLNEVQNPNVRVVTDPRTGNPMLMTVQGATYNSGTNVAKYPSISKLTSTAVNLFNADQSAGNDFQNAYNLDQDGDSLVRELLSFKQRINSTDAQAAKEAKAEMAQMGYVSFEELRDGLAVKMKAQQDKILAQGLGLKSDYANLIKSL